MKEIQRKFKNTEKSAIHKNSIELLNDEELEKVVGGQNYDSRTIGSYYFYDHVSKTDGVIGECYYVTQDGKNHWFYGRLTSKYKEHYFLWINYYWNCFLVYKEDGIEADYVTEVRGDAFTMYKKAFGHADDILK